MLKKLYKITIATEDKSGYSANWDNCVVLAVTAEEAIEKVKKQGKVDLVKGEGKFVDEIENLGVVEIE